MKTYFVKTGSPINEMLLHSIGVGEFSTKDIDRAREVYEKEVEQLAKEYTNVADLPYSPTDDEMRHAIQCVIIAIDEDGDAIDYVETSDYFFEK